MLCACRFRLPNPSPRAMLQVSHLFASDELLSEERTVVAAAEHSFANERNRRAAVFQKLIVEIFPCSAASARGCPVFAQLFNHQLAHRVVEISRIERAARGLLLRVACVLKTLLD